MKVRLQTNENNRDRILDILSANNILVDDCAPIVVSEDGYCNGEDFQIKIVFKNDNISDFAKFISQFNDAKTNDMILGKKNEAYTPIALDTVSYFNAVNNDTFANLENGESYIVRKKLYQLEEELFAAGYFRINKSELVNMKKISLITPMFKGKLLIYLEGYKQPFDISRGYTKAFKERLGF